MTDKKATLIVLAVSVMWGTSFIFSSIAMDSGLTGIEVIFGRFSIGAVVLFALFHKKLKLKEMDKDAIRAGFLSGVVTCIGFVFEMTGISLSTTTKAGFLTSTSVILLPFLYFLIFRQKPKSNSITAAILTIVGIGLLSLKDKFIFEFGDILLLTTAVFYALNSMTVATQSKGCSMLQLTYVQFCVVTVMTLFMLPFSPRGTFNAAGMGAVVYLAIIPTVVCYFLKNYVLKFISPVRCSIIQSTQSIFCAIFSVILLGDIITPKMFMGMVVIMFAIFVEVVLPTIKIKDKMPLKEEKSEI